MADAKITALTEDTSPTIDDLIATVDNPGGTPITKKATISNLAVTLKSVGMLNSKIITANRDLTAVVGDVSYTGVGFKPTSIIALAATSNKIFSIGVSDSAKTNDQINQYGTTPQAVQADSNFLNISTDDAGANAQYANIASFNDDGFTLAWTKAGSPTGTANLIFLCFR